MPRILPRKPVLVQERGIMMHLPRVGDRARGSSLNQRNQSRISVWLRGFVLNVVLKNTFEVMKNTRNLASCKIKIRTERDEAQKKEGAS